MRRSRFLLISMLSIVGLTLYATSVTARKKSPDAKKASELLARLEAAGDRQREEAAEALAELGDGRIVPALKKRLGREHEFHVRLAIHYALASQGEKASVRELIDSLRGGGHLGAVYLERVGGKDYGWDIKRWETWEQGISQDAFQKRAEKQIRRRPAREEWEKFRSQFSGMYFAGIRSQDDEHRSDDDHAQPDETPTAKAWALFASAIRSLQDEGDRKKAAQQFREAATEYPDTFYAEDSRELADLLDAMLEEDRRWKEPQDETGLSQAEQIAYHVYHLRDVVAHQRSQPGYCHVLADPIFAQPGYNAAQALRDLGEAAIPALLELLDDRRPIRAVGYWRNFHPTRTVLRYQDAAIQILNELLPGAVYKANTTSAYFSGEDADERSKLIEQVRKSWQRDKDKSPLERRWAAIDDLGIYPALGVLEKLAEEGSEKPKVLKKLSAMYDERHWVFQPRIAELMAKLGDTSKVPEVLKLHLEGRYSKYLIKRPDDSAASINAEEAAKRLAAEYGKTAR